MSERVSVKLIPVVFNHSWGMRTPAQTINRPAAAVSVRNKTKIKSNASSGLHFLEITLTPFFSFFFFAKTGKWVYLLFPASSSFFFSLLRSHKSHDDIHPTVQPARPVRGPTRCHGSTCLGVCFLRDQRQPITESLYGKSVSPPSLIPKYQLIIFILLYFVVTLSYLMEPYK